MNTLALSEPAVPFVTERTTFHWQADKRLTAESHCITPKFLLVFSTFQT